MSPSSTFIASSPSRLRVSWFSTRIIKRSSPAPNKVQAPVVFDLTRRREGPNKNGCRRPCSRSPRIGSGRSIRRPAGCWQRSRRPAAAATPAWPGPKARCGWASIATARSIRSIPSRRDSPHHRVHPLRHRRHLGRRRALAWHPGRRRKRSPPNRSSDRRGPGAARHAPRRRRVRPEMRRGRSILLRRRKQRKGAGRPTAQARFRGASHPKSRNSRSPRSVYGAQISQIDE
jgi:hypothetical protein